MSVRNSDGDAMVIPNSVAFLKSLRLNVTM